MTSRIAALLIAGMIAVQPLGARAASGAGITVSPARVEPADPIKDRRFDGDVTFTNNTDRSVHIDLSLREIWQNLQGTAVFHDNPSLQAAFRLDRSALDLDPDQAQPVHVSGAIPPSSRSAYVGVLGAFGSQPGSSVAVNSTIASLLLLRGPKPWAERISVTSAGFLNDGKTVYAVVKNIGDVHVAPTGSIEIRKGADLVARVPIGATTVNGVVTGQILPTCDGGCSRRYEGTWQPPTKISGPLTISVVLRGPAARYTTTVPFGGSTGTTTPLADVSFKTASANDVIVVARNSGTVTISQPYVQLQALQDGKFSRALKDFPGGDLRPGETREVAWEPQLTDGEYVLVARVFSGADALAEAQTSLRVGVPSTGEFISRAPALVALVLLIAIGILIALLLRRRRERRRSPT